MTPNGPSRRPYGLAVPWQLVLLATAVAVLMGFLYTLSPVGVWCGAGVVGLFMWAGTGLPARERRWLLSLLAIACLLYTSDAADE